MVIFIVKIMLVISGKVRVVLGIIDIMFIIMIRFVISVMFVIILNVL